MGSIMLGLLTEFLMIGALALGVICIGVSQLTRSRVDPPA